jgi:hypothetical protein
MLHMITQLAMLESTVVIIFIIHNQAASFATISAVQNRYTVKDVDQPQSTSFHHGSL